MSNLESQVTSTPPTAPTAPTSRSRGRTVGITAVVLLGLLLLTAIAAFVIFQPQTVTVGGTSMEPIHEPNARLVVANWGGIERGQIVTFDPTEIDDVPGELPLMKRVVGLAGETVTLVDGEVFVDGELLNEPYLKDAASTYPLIVTGGDEFVVPSDHVFLMGDSRNASTDSRRWGSIPVSSITANRAWVVSSGE